MIYLVTAETGEYADHSEWTVCAYATREQAAAHALAANRWCERKGCDRELSGNWTQAVRTLNAQGCPLDPEFQTDYTGTIYNVTEVPVGADVCHPLDIQRELDR